MTFFPETFKINITYFVLTRRSNLHIHLFLDNYKPGGLKMSSRANKNCGWCYTGGKAKFKVTSRSQHTNELNKLFLKIFGTTKRDQPQNF